MHFEKKKGPLRAHVILRASKTMAIANFVAVCVKVDVDEELKDWRVNSASLTCHCCKGLLAILMILGIASERHLNFWINHTKRCFAIL
jgi:hypothetical protein